MYNCTEIIANIANIVEPFMPETTNTIRKYLQIENNGWEYISLNKDIELNNIKPLFERM